MRKTLIGLVLLSAFYLFTGIVYEEGAFGFQLVVKRHPSIYVRFGGGEEGTWTRENPNSTEPWWREHKQICIASGDWEEGHPVWEQIYLLGYGLLFVAWSIFLAIFLLRLKRTNVAKMR